VSGGEVSKLRAEWMWKSADRKPAVSTMRRSVNLRLCV
jgi:hypothetical protein